MAIIDDISCEAFDGLGVQILVTAINRNLVKKATMNFIALTSIIFGGSEAGLGRNVPESENLDGRPEIYCQLWTRGCNKKVLDNLFHGFGFRVRQALLTTPTVAVFNALDSNTQFDVMDNIGHYGDGYESLVECGRRLCISIPLMMGYDFLIERHIAYKCGVMGGIPVALL